MKKNKQSLTLVDAPLYTYWQAMVLSVYSNRLYIDVGKRWGGYGVLYFLLLFSLLLIPVAGYMSYTFGSYIDENIITPVESLPVIAVEDGKVRFEGEMPFLIKNKSKEIVAMVDTTGQTQSITDAYPHLLFLMTENKIFFRLPKLNLWNNQTSNKGNNPIFEEPITKHSISFFEGKAWVKEVGIQRMKWIGELFIYPLMLGSVFGAVVVFMLFLGFLVELISIIIFKFKISFKMACRLTMVSSTPACVLFFIFYLAKVNVPGQEFFYLSLVAMYSSYAVLSVRRESQQMVFG